MSLVILVRSRASRRTPNGRPWIRDIQGNVRDVVEFLRRTLRKPRRQRQRGHRQTKRLTSRVHYVPLLFLSRPPQNSIRNWLLSAGVFWKT